MKNDGYCLWHPEFGLDPRSYSRCELFCWHNRLGIDSESDYSVMASLSHPAIKAAESLGWQVKPVKIVLMEEPNEKEKSGRHHA